MKLIIMCIIGLHLFWFGYWEGQRVLLHKLEELRPSAFWGHGLISDEEKQRMDSAWEEMLRRSK